MAGRLARRYGDDVDRYLCRSMLRQVGDFLGLALFVASQNDCVLVERRWPNAPDFAFLAGVARRERPAVPEAVAEAIARISFASDDEPRLVQKARALVSAAREVASLWRECLSLVRIVPARLPQRPLLIRSYGEDVGLDRGGHARLRNLDFVVDGRTIAPGEVGVWLEPGVPEDRRGLLEDRGYAVVERSDIAAAPWRLVPRLLWGTWTLVRLALAERWWHRIVRQLVWQDVLWSELARATRPRVLLALNDIHPSGVARTLALRRLGCATVEYEFSSHWLTDEQAWIPDYVYGFTVLDAMVSWGPMHSEHFANHRGSIREFWDVGCLWSEHARLVRDDPDIGARYRAALGVSLDEYEAVVGVFDTSTASFFTADDMTAFYEGVTEIAPEHPRVLFLCKPKRPLETMFAAAARGAEVEAALKSMPNIVVLEELFETAAVVGVSDVSVNACFTSTAVETIGLGRPALYYDPTDLFPASFFRRTPGFVATTAPELSQLLRQQLDDEPGERDADLRKRFTTLEGHFDGLGITRMRQRLRVLIDS